ncbi:MAG: trypsin-like peptidase domain-containing protein [Victivallales bacterium]|nr:trypsin-like peptidase domain-containing protein [Victivallales bacterium]
MMMPVFGNGGNPPPPAPSSARLTPAVTAVCKALPWVVNIGTNQKIIQINDPFSLFFTEYFNRHLHATTQLRYSPLGSGVIVDSRGLILTNSHVVRRAQQIEVRLLDGSAYSAAVVGYDVPNDLCLLQILDLPEDVKLIAAQFAYANDLLLGESVIAIGNPFGLEHSVSEGTLSAFNRSFQDGEVAFKDIIQTDAAINPGNSGGPLINLDGNLIGINLAIRADAQGICFAIPMARAEMFLSYWLKPSHFSDGYIGIMPGAAVTSFRENGIVLPKLMSGGPLEKAGFREGDVISAVNGVPVRRQIDFGRQIWNLKSGDVIKVTDGGGKEYQVEVEEMPAEMLVKTRLGLKVQELTPAVRRAMAVPDEMRGIMVSEVIHEPFFAMQGARWRHVVRRGDIIVRFGQMDLESLEDLAAGLKGTRSGDVGQLGFLSFAADRMKYMPLMVEQLQLN